jgi:hypothetical protein
MFPRPVQQIISQSRREGQARDAKYNLRPRLTFLQVGDIALQPKNGVETWPL